MCFNESVDWVAPNGMKADESRPSMFSWGLCGSNHVRPFVPLSCPSQGQAPTKCIGSFLLADRTPHVSRGQYSGPLGVKRKRLNNNPAQPDLLKVLARTAEIGNGRLANDTGLLEEELSHFVRGSQVSVLYVSDGLKLGSFLAWVVLSPEYNGKRYGM